MGESPASKRGRTGTSPYISLPKRGVPSTILQEKIGFDHFLPICRRCIGRKARQAVAVAYFLARVLLLRFQKTQEVPYSCHFLPHAPQSDTYDFRRLDSASDLLDTAPPPSGMTVACCPETHFRELPLHHLWEQECAEHDSAVKSSPYPLHMHFSAPLKKPSGPESARAYICSRLPSCHSALTHMYTASV